MIKIKRGLDIPLAGAPSAEIESAPATRAVALLGGDYHGMKPTMAVQVGDVVKRGDLLFTDKKCEGVRYTAPAGGRVASINRGAQRAFQSVVIEIDGDEPALFQQYSSEAARELSPETIKQQLIESGQWTALKARPFGRVADPATTPAGLFITAIDTHPHAPDPEQLIALEAEAFEVGQVLLANMVACPVYLCAAPAAQMPQAAHERLSRHDFSGPHPAGLAGTHVHFLMGASVEKIAWTIGYQDVIAMGRLFLDGALYTDRIISLAGPAVSRPRLVSSRVGADLQALVAGEQHAEEARLLSGSVLGGRAVQSDTAYLGRYHQQVSLLPEGRDRAFMGWLSLGLQKHSVMGIYLSSWLGSKPLAMSTNTNGSERAMVPVGAYEKVMPLDILPTQLLRALLVGDTETAQALGCLELDEEDLALCTYVCPGKYEYGGILRDNLTQIEKEG
ncbi:MAG: Na(+)-translocating NADH-quinone reductase subunit A [Luminiphilus sp.]|nr:Na(+)-translocating NADH-quinone reductase subunit A [Luminiphilus sp.]MDG2038182.1 Na(+)-translocating NADH-quinone reductase subunit A [Luminiphilus sp.]